MDHDAPVEPQRLHARPATAPAARHRPFAVPAVLATVVMAGTLAGSGAFGRILPPFLLHGADRLTSTQQQARIEAFNAVEALPVAAVEDKDIGRALAGMQLDAPARQALAHELRADADAVALPASLPASLSTPLPTSSPTSPPTPNPTPAAAPTGQAAVATPATAPTPAPRAAVVPAPKPVRAAARLVWITLWDTDDEDGDVVRIHSQGYSRVVALTREPVTFAVPVLPSGVVDVAGVRDGEGGGVTIGVASGTSRVTLPIMSVGQTIGLHIKG